MGVVNAVSLMFFIVEKLMYFTVLELSSILHFLCITILLFQLASSAGFRVIVSNLHSVVVQNDIIVSFTNLPYFTGYLTDFNVYIYIINISTCW